MSRDDDAKVAELIFGWEWLERMNDFSRVSNKPEPRKALMCPEGDRWIRFNWYAPDWKPARPETERFSDWANCCGRRHMNGHDMESWGVPKYTTDPAADYTVLVRVREKWHLDSQTAFRDAIEQTWAHRTRMLGGKLPFHLLAYEVGDYSKAALKVMEETSG